MKDAKSILKGEVLKNVNKELEKNISIEKRLDLLILKAKVESVH